MDIRRHELLRERADFHLCLARAFRAPMDGALGAAMREVLADDLAGLAASLGWDIAAPLADYRAQMCALPDDASLLQVYSALFLVPPVAARINAGFYLDGALDGGSVKALEAAYAACGLRRDDRFRDLADHVSVQLEFTAWLFAREAGHFQGACDPPPIDAARFLRDHPQRWIAAACEDLEQVRIGADVAANPYRALARIVRVAVDADAASAEIDAKAARRQRAIEQARAKASARGIGAGELDEIRRRLREHGLSTDHLEMSAAERDAGLGLRESQTPGVR